MPLIIVGFLVVLISGILPLIIVGFLAADVFGLCPLNTFGFSFVNFCFSSLFVIGLSSDIFGFTLGFAFNFLVSVAPGFLPLIIFGFLPLTIFCCIFIFLCLSSSSSLIRI